jgi:hypothetical protein
MADHHEAHHIKTWAEEVNAATISEDEIVIARSHVVDDLWACRKGECWKGTAHTKIIEAHGHSMGNLVYLTMSFVLGAEVAARSRTIADHPGGVIMADLTPCASDGNTPEEVIELSNLCMGYLTHYQGVPQYEVGADTTLFVQHYVTCPDCAPDGSTFFERLGDLIEATHVMRHMTLSWLEPELTQWLCALKAPALN